MQKIVDGETVLVQGSGKKPYELKNIGGVYSCSCPAWRNAGGPIDKRTCKHLKKYCGEDIELVRIGEDQAPQQCNNAVTEDSVDNSPPILLAHKWEPTDDPTGWWISEKLDGVRAYWDGQQFLSRLGNKYFAPEWFTRGLPPIPLDGELWVGRKQFQKTVSIVRRQDAGEQWRDVKFLIFDAPQLDLAYEERINWIKSFVEEKTTSFTEFVENIICTGFDHLKSELDRVEKLGGEGLMLRSPGSKYEVGRSKTLLKVKTFYDDEAVVVGHENGKGKHKGRLGALILEMPNKKQFRVGTGLSDKERNDPPLVGTIITYRYQELSDDGIPRFPSYIGIAIDKK